MDTASEIWWRQITGARKFLDGIVDASVHGKSALVCLNDKTPWLDDMRAILTEFLNKKFRGTKTVCNFDAAQVTEPETFVFENFCSEDVREQLIPIDEKACVRFLAERDDISLNNACLWIRGADKAQATQWLAFIDDYHKFLRGSSGGVFLVETNATFDDEHTNVENFSFADEVNEYDCFVFNTFIASQFGTGDRFTKRYLAELATNATGFDVEAGAHCIERGNDFLRNPRAVLPDKTQAEIERAVWVTQLKLIFPLLEIFRRDFAKKYNDLIASRLPCTRDNKTVTRPEEAEFGDLLFITAYSDGRVDPNDRNKLKTYRDVRNKLAHLETLSTAQVQSILHDEGGF